MAKTQGQTGQNKLGKVERSTYVTGRSAWGIKSVNQATTHSSTDQQQELESNGLSCMLPGTYDLHEAQNRLHVFGRQRSANATVE